MDSQTEREALVSRIRGKQQRLREEEYGRRGRASASPTLPLMLQDGLWADPRFWMLPARAREQLQWCARHADGSLKVWHSERSIALALRDPTDPLDLRADEDRKRVGALQRKVRERFAAAERAGLVERLPHFHDQDGRQVSNTYLFDPGLLLRHGVNVVDEYLSNPSDQDGRGEHADVVELNEADLSSDVAVQVRRLRNVVQARSRDQ